MKRSRPAGIAGCHALAIVASFIMAGSPARSSDDLLFAARFDDGFDADFARGNPVSTHSDRLAPAAGHNGGGLIVPRNEWIRYDLPGNLSLREGTITFLVKPHFTPPAFRPDNAEALQCLFGMRIRTGPVFELRLRNGEKGSNLELLTGNKPGEQTTLRLPVEWREGEWSRVTVSWQQPGRLALSVNDGDPVIVNDAKLPDLPEHMFYDLFLGTNTSQSAHARMEHFDGTLDDFQVFGRWMASPIVGELPPTPAVAAAEPPAVMPQWIGPAPHRIDFVVGEGDERFERFPIRFDVELGQKWSQLTFAQRREAIGGLRLVKSDPKTGKPIAWNEQLSGDERYYMPFQPSEELLTSSRGVVRWMHEGRESAVYSLYFDPDARGVAPFPDEIPMVGNGDRLRTGTWTTPGRLAVGAWGNFDVVDLNGDGAMDIWMASGFQTRSCYHLMNGHYYFENLGSAGNTSDIYAQPALIMRGNTPTGYLEGQVVPQLIDLNGDGRLDLALIGRSNHEWAEFEMRGGVPVITAIHAVEYRGEHPARTFGRTRLHDWNGDGLPDIWAEKTVYLNVGETGRPVFDMTTPIALPIKGETMGYLFQPVDWDGDGLVDLVSAQWQQRIEWHRNIGTSDEPRFGAAQEIRTFDDHAIFLANQLFDMKVVDWDSDGDLDLLWGSEDGWLGMLENIAGPGRPPQLLQTVFLQQMWAPVDAGTIAVPVLTDWDDDGDDDMIIGNSNEFIAYYENRGTQQRPLWAVQQNMQASNAVIEMRAGPEGSVQGPEETGWGYTNPEVVDWDGDGRRDLIISGIWGNHTLFRNVGTPGNPQLLRGRLIDVAWGDQDPARPEWITFTPRGNELITVWRTRPVAIDWDRDGLMDYVTLDHKGDLALYRRTRSDGGEVVLLPAEYPFTIEGPHAQAMTWNRPPNARDGRTGRTVINLVDWNRDGLIDLVLDGMNGRLFLNTTDNDNPVFVDQGDLVRERLANHNAAPYIHDWDGDGWHDLFMGTESGQIFYFHRAYIENAIPLTATLGMSSRP
jgi:hypothetical protein